MISGRPNGLPFCSLEDANGVVYYVVRTVEVGTAASVTLTEIAGKDVVVKIGAESAEMSISVKRTY